MKRHRNRSHESEIVPSEPTLPPRRNRLKLPRAALLEHRVATRAGTMNSRFAWIVIALAGSILLACATLWFREHSREPSRQPSASSVRHAESGVRSETPAGPALLGGRPFEGGEASRHEDPPGASDPLLEASRLGSSSFSEYCSLMWRVWTRLQEDPDYLARCLNFVADQQNDITSRVQLAMTVSLLPNSAVPNRQFLLTWLNSEEALWQQVGLSCAQFRAIPSMTEEQLAQLLGCSYFLLARSVQVCEGELPSFADEIPNGAQDPSGNKGLNLDASSSQAKVGQALESLTKLGQLNRISEPALQDALFAIAQHRPSLAHQLLDVLEPNERTEAYAAEVAADSSATAASRRQALDFLLLSGSGKAASVIAELILHDDGVAPLLDFPPHRPPADVHAIQSAILARYADPRCPCKTDLLRLLAAWDSPIAASGFEVLLNSESDAVLRVVAAKSLAASSSGIAPSTRQHLLEGLARDSDGRVRQEALVGLIHLPASGTSPLNDFLDSDFSAQSNTAFRRRLSEELGRQSCQVSSERRVRCLDTLAVDSELAVRSTVLNALSALPPSQAIPILTRVVARETDPALRERARHILERMQSSSNRK